MFKIFCVYPLYFAINYIDSMKQTFLHVAVLDDFNECFVSRTADCLREQVSEYLLRHSMMVPTDAEWALTLGEDRDEVNLTTPANGWITYYTASSKMAGPEYRITDSENNAR